MKVNYKGGQGYLTEEQRHKVIFFLRQKPYYSVEQLRDYIERYYGVVYPSKPSYDDLLKAGGLSGHQTPAMNPKRDETPVLQKREEIQKKLAEHEAEIKSGERMVFAEDECH